MMTMEEEEEEDSSDDRIARKSKYEYAMLYDSHPCLHNNKQHTYHIITKKATT